MKFRNPETGRPWTAFVCRATKNSEEAAAGQRKLRNKELDFYYSPDTVVVKSRSVR
jgi:hypothetical protein